MEAKADDDELERLAVEEIMQEAKRGAERSKEMGALGWMKPNVPSTNKNFLRNTLVSTLRDPYGSRRNKKTYSYRKPNSFDRGAHRGSFSHNHSQSRHSNESYRHSRRSHNDATNVHMSSSSSDTSPNHDPSADSKTTTQEIPEKTPEGGYIYDAYSYGFQGANDPMTHEKVSKSQTETNSKDTKKHHRSGSSRDSHVPSSNGHSSSHRKRKSSSSDHAGHSSRKRKKSKKEHKHKHNKDKHKSKHKKKRH